MKNRIVGYICLIFISIVVVLIYIDASLFSNVRKTIYSYRYDINVRSFEYVKKTIQPDNLMGGELKIKDGVPYLYVRGFEPNRLDLNDKSLLKRKQLHPTQQLVLFSFPYLSEYLLNKTICGQLSIDDSRMIQNVYSYVSEEITNPLSVNTMTVNDHVISDRVQFLVLYISYLNSNESNNKKLINQLKKDLSTCLGFLLNDDFFTWQSNHGIMQIRALAQIASVTTDNEIVRLCTRKIDKRLSDILPFFVGDDGAIYESAPGYWLLIYDQFSKISALKICDSLHAVKELRSRVVKMKEFIDVVSINDGFLQGMGDSYSSVSSKANHQVVKNRVFSFSNKLVGFNWTSDSVNSGILFVSLSTPPDVHKHPEDLALYVYSNGPFFGNTGIYSYQESETRAYFRTELSQNTVSFSERNISQLRGSDITKQKDGLYVGKKWYDTGDTILRELRFFNSCNFQIKDYSNTSGKIRSRFIIDFKNKSELIDDKTIRITNAAGNQMYMQASVPLQILKTIQSNKYNNLVEAQVVELVADSLCVNFKLDDSLNQALVHDQFTELKNSYKCKRYNVALKLNAKYDSHNADYQDIKGIIIKSFSYTLFLLLISITIAEVFVLLYGKSKRRKY